jgi:hypothetical protein
MRLQSLSGAAVLALFFSACGQTTTTSPPSKGTIGTPSSGAPNASAAVKDLPRHEEDAPRPEDDLAVFPGKRVEVVTTQGHRFQVAAEHDPWADAVVSYKPGNPAPQRSRDPRSAVGKPDYKGTDDAEDEKRYVALGHGGELVLEFRDNVLVDGPGDDLVIFEIGESVEPTVIAISSDAKHWIEVGQTKGGKSSVDIRPFVKPGQRFRFVRVTDAKAGLSNHTYWPGADIDAVGALHSLPTAQGEKKDDVPQEK